VGCDRGRAARLSFAETFRCADSEFIRAALDRPDDERALATFMRFADGRVIEFREFSDTFDVVQQALALQLPFCFEVRALGGRLMSPAPE